MRYKRASLVDPGVIDMELAVPCERRQAGSILYRRVAVAAAAATLLLGLACGRNIGDSCSSSADCDPTSGTRTCDLSQPAGYCVLEGCDARSCPGDSACVRVFPGAFLEKTCSSDMPCATDEICLGYQPAAGADGGAGSNATPAAGYCARLSLEKRLCLRTCGGNGDCRGGYACYRTGVNGTLALTLDPAATPPSYCAPAR
jgi:hypothetical protein